MTPSIHLLHLDTSTIATMYLGASSTAPLVFLHGLGDSSIITFRRIALHPALHDTPSLLLDLPGFGHSPAPASGEISTEGQARQVATVLDHLGIVQTTIVGHSMGGSISILLAHQRPDLVSRLIVAEPLLEPSQSELGKTIAKRTEAQFVERGYDMLKLATRRQASRGELAALGFQDPLSRANPAIMHRSATSLLQERLPSFRDLLAALPIPKTLILGARTDIDVAPLADQGVTIIRIPDAGHSMMSENPDAFAKAISNALRTDRRSVRNPGPG